MFILFFDDRYFKWASPLIESITIHEPGERIGIYGFNLNESQAEKLRSYPNVVYIPSVLHKAVFKRRKREDSKAARIIQRIASYFLDAFHRFPEEKLYMVLDVDSLLIRPLTEIKREMADYDIGISEGSQQIKVGFVLVNPTDASKKLVENWNDLLMEDSCYWSKGQITLFHLYQEHKDKMNFLEFGIPYRDPASKNDSYIWSAYKTTYGSKTDRHVLYEKKLDEMRGNSA